MPSTCVCLSVCVSVILNQWVVNPPTAWQIEHWMRCLSITLRYCIKTAKRRITQIPRHDSPRTLVFWHQSSRRNSKGITPYGGDKCRWGGLKVATFDEKRAITRKRYKLIRNITERYICFLFTDTYLLYLILIMKAEVVMFTMCCLRINF